MPCDGSKRISPALQPVEKALVHVTRWFVEVQGGSGEEQKILAPRPVLRSPVRVIEFGFAPFRRSELE